MSTTPVVHAQDAQNAQGSSRRRAAGNAPREALEFYQRGRELYQQGRYPEAAAELERAVVLDPSSPTLVYNVARVRELMRDYEPAIAYYERFLQLIGTRQPEDRTRVEATLDRLRGALELQRRQQAEEEAARVAEEERIRQAHEQELREAEARARPPDRVRGLADLGFWLTLSFGVATLGAGGTLAYFAWADAKNAETFYIGYHGTYAERQQYVDQSRAYALTADICFGVGGALVVTSLLLYLLRFREVPVEQPAPTPGQVFTPELQLSVAPNLNGGATFVLGGSF